MPKVLVVFGSKSDEPVYKKIIKGLKKGGIEAELRISSAHRTPEELDEIIKTNCNLIIAGAGLSAALPGVIASKTIKPIIGIPCHGSYQGLDALLSIMQMPSGIPVLAVGINQAEIAVKNAIKILKPHVFVNLISEIPNDAVSKAEKLFAEFDIAVKKSESVENDSINIEFVSLDEPIPEKEALVIYCPVLLKDDDKAEAALNVLKHSNHGLWVGLNNGKNAALAAIEILNFNDKYTIKLNQYREKLKSKVKESDKEVKGGNNVSDNKIKQQINFTLKETNFPNLGKKYKGKVRDVYIADDKIFLISTDRQSAFDRNLANIPFKGQVLTQTSAFWFKNTKDIIQNHVIDVPDPNVVVCKKLKVFPIEMVIRGYITGVTSTSAWTAYQKGERNFCGNILPEGLKKNQKFDTPIITPTTKSEEHDEKISGEEIIKRNLTTKEQWDFISEKALQLFQRGTEIAEKNGLILVDTKYEFGYDDQGNIYVIDEIHTPDSSRFWIEDTYEGRLEKGEEPENIDKEFLRLWFKEHCDPYKDKELPEAPEELVIELSKRYIKLYEMITGNEFKTEVGDVKGRIEKNLKNAGYL